MPRRLIVLFLVAFLLAPLLAPVATPKLRYSISAQGQEDNSVVAMYRGNPARTGEIPRSGGLGDQSSLSLPNNRFIWPIFSSVVVDDVLYVGNGACVCAIDVRSGSELWRNSAYVMSNVLATDDEVFFADADGNVRSLDIASGKERWSFATTGGYINLPMVADDLVYVAAGGGSVYALDRATGQER